MADKVLIIDDDCTLLDVQKTAFELEGYIVFGAENGEDGLISFQKNRPDAVILDMNMPGMNGLDVLREIKKINPVVPVIIMTGFGTIKSSVTAMQLGAYDYMEKPPDFERLMKILQSAIKNSTKCECALLSSREIEVLRWTALGKNAGDISILLNISEHTVHHHSKKIKEKLIVSNITHAVHIATVQGFLNIQTNDHNIQV